MSPFFDTSDHGEGPDTPTGEGAELLDQLHAALARYVIFPSPEAADAATLWVAATHAQDAWEHATRLVVKSPLKRCGKSRLLDLVEHLAHNVLVTGNISPAALARSVTATDPPTLVCDEMDAVFIKRGGERSEAAEILRGLINSGHQRGRPYTRWDVTTRQLEQCPTFAMAALAGIGDLPDTIEDRGVIVTMRRRARGEQVTPLRRRRDVPALLDLRGRLHAWVRDNQPKLETAEPVMPVEDRAADCWEPLVAVADLAGGSWATRARKACTAMADAAEADMEGPASERLLAELRDVFGHADALFTTTVLGRLHKLDEAPWGDWYGKPLAARDLAKLLRPYGVKSRSVREAGADHTQKGYRRVDLHDTWQRYAPTATQAAQAAQQGISAGQPCSASVPDVPKASGAATDVPAVPDGVPASGTRSDQQEQAVVPAVPAVPGVAPTSGHETHEWQCARCGHRTAASMDMAGFPHPCDDGERGRFQAATPQVSVQGGQP